MFLEHWNRQKSLSDIRQCFSCLLDEWIAKKCKTFFFHGGFWDFFAYLNALKTNSEMAKDFHDGFFLKSTLSVLRCTWTGRINLKIFLGHHINYLSIWPFMCHPWFPTRKASKLTFVCLSSPCNVFNTWCWKQTNVSFEAFLVGNQGWHIKGQMLR